MRVGVLGHRRDRAELGSGMTVPKYPCRNDPLRCRLESTPECEDRDDIGSAQHCCSTRQISHSVHGMQDIGKRLLFKSKFRADCLIAPPGHFQIKIVAQHRLASYKRICPAFTKISSIKLENFNCHAALMSYSCIVALGKS